MKRNLHIIQINGLRGLLTVLFAGSCLIAGFAVFPGFLLMVTWNSLTAPTFLKLTLLEGVLLWGIIITSYLIIRKQQFSISFGLPKELTDDELKKVIEQAQSELEEGIKKSIPQSLPEIKEHTEQNQDEIIHK